MENQKQPFQIALCEFPQDQTPGFQCGRVYQGALHGFASPQNCQSFFCCHTLDFPHYTEQDGQKQDVDWIVKRFSRLPLDKTRKAT